VQPGFAMPITQRLPVALGVQITQAADGVIPRPGPTHASALIAAGLDVVVISRRLGHGSPNVTLRIYAHLFKKDDTAAAAAIEAVKTRTRSEPSGS
jgi:integrase